MCLFRTQLTYYQAGGFGDVSLQEYGTYNSATYSYIRRVPDFAEHCGPVVPSAGFYPDQGSLVADNGTFTNVITTGEFYGSYDVVSSSSSSTS